MNYPENALKGISNQNFMISNNLVGAELFYFNDKFIRQDNWIEQSINWEDDEQALRFTLNQRKNADELKFKAGVAVLPRIEIEHLNQRPGINGVLSYERAELQDNPYHGNILLKKEVPRKTMKMIAASRPLHLR